MQYPSFGNPDPQAIGRPAFLFRWAKSAPALVAGLLALAGGAQAQAVSTYSFSQGTAAYAPLTGATVVATANATTDDLDGTVFADLPIGFTFRFNGANYTLFTLSSNGFLTFGPTPPEVFDAPISSSTGYNGAAAPLGTDLVGNTTAATGAPGQLSYQTLGMAPARTLVVQFSRFQPFGSPTTLLDFQVLLSEGSNVVRFAYGPFQTAATLNIAAQVGLRGGNNSQFNNRTTTTDWTQTTPGTSSAAAMTLTNAVKPASGLVYSFTPPNACASPQSLSVRNITDNSAELTFTAATPAPAGGYTVSTIPASGGGGQAVSSSPFVLNGLSAGTSYTATLVSNCAGGATSVPVSVSFTTVATCTAPTAVAVSNATSTGARVSFAPGNGNTAFVATATPASGGNGPVSASGPASPLTLAGLASGIRYNVVVTGTCANGGSATSAPAASFVTLPSNDEPAGAIALTVSPTCTATNAANVGATPTPPNGYTNPGTCGAAANPKDVWFSFVTAASGPGASAVRLTVGGTAAGTVRVFAAANGAAGPLAAIACAAGTTNNTQAPPLDATGLAAGTTYFVAVSGFGSSDVEGTFTICATAPAAPACAAPTNVAASSVTANSASIGFVAGAGATTYTVAYTPQGGTAQTATGGASPIALSGLTAGTAYSATVTSNCGGGQTATSSAISFATSAPAPTDLTVGSGQTATASGPYRNITVQAGGTLTLTAPTSASGTVSVSGTLVTNCQVLGGAGSFALNAGGELQICAPGGISGGGASGAVQTTGTRSFSADASYVYDGAAAQVTGSGLPATVRNLTVNNAADLALTQAVAVRQLARLQRGDLNTGGNGFTLLSVPGQGTAVLDNAGGTVNGTGTLQRAIDANNAAGSGYRHYAAPVRNTTVADLAAPGFAPVLNGGYNSSPTASRSTPFPTVFGYEQGRVATATSDYQGFAKGWFSPMADTDPLLPNRGYTANVANGVPVDFVGTFNNGPQTPGALARSPGPDAGWHLLGNPYPSPLDWSSVTPAQRPGLDAALYVFQSTGQYTGTYRVFLPGISNPAIVSPLVEAGQGYFARVSTAGTPGTVALTNANRVATFGPQSAFGRGTATPALLHLQVATATRADDAFVYFAAGNTAAFNPAQDAAKLFNPSGLSLATQAGTEAVAINGLPLLATAETAVPLHLTVPTAGTYTFRVQALPTLPPGTQLFLRDTQTGTQTPLGVGSTHAAILAAGSSTGRFVLVFRPTGTALAAATGLQAAQVSVYPNPAHDQFTVVLPPVAGQSAVQATLLNALGQTLQTRPIALSAAGAVAEFRTATLAPGVYLLRLQAAGGPAVVRRVVVE